MERDGYPYMVNPPILKVATGYQLPIEMNNRRTGYCSNGFYAQLQTPPESVPYTPRVLESTPRTHFASQSVVEQQEELRLLRSQQEHSSSQVQDIASRLTAMEKHLMDISLTQTHLLQSVHLLEDHSKKYLLVYQ